MLLAFNRAWISLFKCSFPQFSNKIHRQLFFCTMVLYTLFTIVYNKVQPLISCKLYTRKAWHSLITFNLQIRHLSAVVCRFYPGDAFTYRLGSIRCRYVLCYYSTVHSNFSDSPSPSTVVASLTKMLPLHVLVNLSTTLYGDLGYMSQHLLVYINKRNRCLLHK